MMLISMHPKNTSSSRLMVKLMIDINEKDTHSSASKTNDTYSSVSQLNRYLFKCISIYQ